jgi:hypothetical protein
VRIGADVVLQGLLLPWLLAGFKIFRLLFLLFVVVCC